MYCNQRLLFYVFAFGISCTALYSQDGRWRVVDSLEPQPGNFYTVRQIIAPTPDRVMIVADGASGDTSIIRRTIDGGQTWQTVWADTTELTGIPTRPVDDALKVRNIVAPTANLVIAVGDSGTLWRSTDFGDSWTLTKVGDPNKGIVQLAMADSTYGLIYRKNQFWRSENGGESWDPMETNLQEFEGIDPVLMHMYSRDSWLMVFTGFQAEVDIIASTADGGQTWEKTAIPRFSSDLLMRGNRGWIVGSGPVIEGEVRNDRIRVTTDSGKTWTTVLDELVQPHFGLTYVSFANETVGFAVGRSWKVLRSTDGGYTWKAELSGIPDEDIFGIGDIAYPSPDVAYVTARKGRVFRWSPNTDAVEEDVHDSQHHLVVRVIEQPTIESLAFAIELPTSGEMQILVVDLLGRLVHSKTYTNVHAGERQFVLDSPQLTSGTYVLQVRSGEQVGAVKFHVVQ